MTPYGRKQIHLAKLHQATIVLVEDKASRTSLLQELRVKISRVFRQRPRSTFRATDEATKTRCLDIQAIGDTTRAAGSLGKLVTGPVTSSPSAANPRASITSPLAARQSQVRRAIIGCGADRVRAPPASGRPSANKRLPSSAMNRSGLSEAAPASSTSQARGAGRFMQRLCRHGP